MRPWTALLLWLEATIVAAGCTAIAVAWSFSREAEPLFDGFDAALPLPLQIVVANVRFYESYLFLLVFLRLLLSGAVWVLRGIPRRVTAFVALWVGGAYLLECAGREIAAGVALLVAAGSVPWLYVLARRGQATNGAETRSRGERLKAWAIHPLPLLTLPWALVGVALAADPDGESYAIAVAVLAGVAVTLIGWEHARPLPGESGQARGRRWLRALAPAVIVMGWTGGLAAVGVWMTIQKIGVVL